MDVSVNKVKTRSHTGFIGVVAITMRSSVTGANIISIFGNDITVFKPHAINCPKTIIAKILNPLMCLTTKGRNVDVNPIKPISTKGMTCVSNVCIPCCAQNM